MCNEVARAKKIFLGTGSLQASHGCSAHTVLKNKDPQQGITRLADRQVDISPLKGYHAFMPTGNPDTEDK